MFTLNKHTGFTLVELLVVIAIIGILAAVIFAGFGDAKITAKNKALRTEMKEIQLAIELYKAQTGVYPDAYTSGSGNGSCYGTTGMGDQRRDWAARGGSCALNLTTDYIVGLVPEFIVSLPSKLRSANQSCGIKYMVDFDDHAWYKLVAENCVGGGEEVQSDDELARCVSTACPLTCTDAYRATEPFTKSYAVYSAGGECF